MIRGELAIRINMSVLIVVGALLLSLAQNDYSIFLITLAVTSLTFVIIDSLKLIHVHPYIANTLAVVVSLYSMSQFAGGNAATKLNAVANLLTYLQLILLLQRKTPRLYWQVMMLSLLQVVVAAALNLSFSAGLTFFAFVFLTGMAMVHLNEYRTFHRLAETNEKSRQPSRRKSRRQEPFPGHVFFELTEETRRTGRRFVQQGTLMSLAGVLFAFTVFYSVPRYGSAWYGPNSAGESVTGFDTEVRFGDEGFLRESNELVMRVSFVDQNNRPVRLAVEPYLRGLILTDYNQLRGSWGWINPNNSKLGKQGRSRLPLKFLPSESPVRNYPLLRQIVRLENAAKILPDRSSDDHLLFSTFPTFRNSATPQCLFRNPLAELLYRDLDVTRQSVNGPYHYETVIPYYRNLGQLPATPLNTWGSSKYLRELTNQLLGRSLNKFPTDWKPIAELATEVRLQSEDPNDRRIVCNEMMNYLRTEKFVYTRDFRNVKRDKNLDPIVDFLLNHRSGHCEYYATALALMLRSQGIPCRLVSGFRGGDFNELAGFYDVREKHAHTWVEAMLSREDCLDTDMVETGQVGNSGAWLRLDPTPSNSAATKDFSRRNLIDRASDAIGFVHKLWDDYVMGLDNQSRAGRGFDPTDPSQTTGLPIVDFVSAVTTRIQNFFASIRLVVWILIGVSVLILFSLVLFFRTRASMIQQGGSISTMVILKEMMRVSLKKIAQPARRLLDRTRGGQDRRPLPQVPFFEEFIQILRPFGFVRTTNQTQLEFAAEVKERLDQREWPQRVLVRDSIDEIVAAFYRARFASEDSAEVDRAAMSKHLNQLQKGLADWKQATSPNADS